MISGGLLDMPFKAIYFIIELYGKSDVNMTRWKWDVEGKEKYK